MTTVHDPPDLGLLIQSGLDDLVLALGKERDRAIAAQRFGLEDGRSHTLEEIGLRHGVTRERVRQVLLRCRRSVRYQLGRAERGDVDRPLRHLAHALRPLTHDEAGLFAPDRAAQVVVHHLDHLDLQVGAHLVEWLARENKDRGVTVAIHAAAKVLLRDLLAEERRQRFLQRRLADLLRDVRFPGGERAYTPEELGPLLRARQPRDGEGFYSRKLGRPVAYDSKTEGRVLQHLEAHPAVRAYQEQPLAIPYEHEGRSRRYFPDILMHLYDGRVVLIEVKPPLYMAASVNLSKWGAMKALCTERGYGLLITDGRTTLLDVVRRAHRAPELAGRLQALLDEHRTLSFPTYLAQMGQPLPLALDFAAVVIRHRLPFQVYPFRLGAPPDESLERQEEGDAGPDATLTPTAGTPSR